MLDSGNAASTRTLWKKDAFLSYSNLGYNTTLSGFFGVVRSGNQMPFSYPLSHFCRLTEWAQSGVLLLLPKPDDTL